MSALIEDFRLGTVSLFADLSAENRTQLAVEAWKIGLSALGSAYAQARELRLDDIGREMVGDIKHQLDAFIRDQEQTVSRLFGRYFDPDHGEFSHRLAGFVADDGQLQRVLREHVALQQGTLTEILVQHVGESSPLLRTLDPDADGGVVKALEQQIRAVIAAEHDGFVRALDPLAPDGAVARFLRSLREELRRSDDDREKQLVAATSALDANNPQSLINRLVGETHAARQALLHAINPEQPGSPLAVIKDTLTATLSEYGKEHRDVLHAQETRRRVFEQQVTDALARLEGGRQRDDRSPAGGVIFEEKVSSFVREAISGGPYVTETTSHVVGLRKACKVGDQVVRFTSESAFHGACLVIEAKHDARYTVAKALAELDIAKANRGACAGLFVISEDHAGDDFPLINRYGNNILVRWDDRDPNTDSYLRAAVLLGLLIASLRQRPRDAGRIDALVDLEARIQGEAKRLEVMNKSNDAIRRNSDVIGDEIRKAAAQFEVLIRRGKETLAALDVAPAHDAELGAALESISGDESDEIPF